MSLLFFALVFGVGIAAGFLNVIAGGGSLLVLPTLVFLGLGIDVANATNRVAILLQNIVAVREFHRKGVLLFRDVLPFIIPAIAGAIAGSFLAISLDKRILEIVVAMAISVMAVFLVLKPRMWEEKREATVPKWVIWLVFFLIGIYGGFIQAGVGFFFIWGLVGIGGLDLLTTNAVKVTIIALYTVFSLTIFLLHGCVDLKVGLVLAAGNIVGALMGTHFAISKGNRALRLVLAVVVIVSAVKMLWSAFGA